MLLHSLVGLHRSHKMTFMYFGYGSNLLRERLLLDNPSAKFVGVAQLMDHTLMFSCFGHDPRTLRWRGGAASITEAPGQSLWGCVWNLDNKHMKTLDRQEGVYDAKEVEVRTRENTTYTCRTYQLPEKLRFDKKFDCRPSPAYMDVIIRGAKQNGLPGDYITLLEQIETNCCEEKPDVYKKTLAMLDG